MFSWAPENAGGGGWVPGVILEVVGGLWLAGGALGDQIAGRSGGGIWVISDSVLARTGG